MVLLLITIGVFVACYAAFVIFFPTLIPGGSSANRTKGALQDLFQHSRSGGTQNLSEETKYSANDILHDEYSETSPIVEGFYSVPLLKNLYPIIVQAGHQRDAGLIVVLLFGLLFGLLALFLYGGFGPVSLLLAPLFAYFIPLKYFKRKVRKRNTAFINLFPDVLDMFVRSVRSGFPISMAFKMVADNMDPPVSTEFRQVVGEVAMGMSVSESLQRLANRINEPDIQFFVVVLTVQQETGGNLAEVVSNLSGIIRKRKQLRLKIKAMTSEGRATAIILGSLPVFIFFVLYFIRRDYLEPLWEERSGQVVLGSSIGLVVMCMWIVNQMVDIDI